MATVKFTVKTISDTTAGVIAGNAAVEGAPPLAWWRRQARSLREKYADQIRISMRNGESIVQGITRLVGGTINGTRVPGVMKAARRDAGALVATSMSNVANKTRLATFQRHADVIKAIQQISTLDSRTSDICIAYSDKVWDVVTLTPIGHTLPFNGGPPRHFNCRSTLIAVTRSFEELGIPGVDLPPGTRASMNGAVPGDTTIDDFLRGRTKAQQDEQLGVGKARLWRAGKISLSQLVDFKGDPKTLATLEAEVAARTAARKAGSTSRLTTAAGAGAGAAIPDSLAKQGEDLGLSVAAVDDGVLLLRRKPTRAQRARLRSLGIKWRRA